MPENNPSGYINNNGYLDQNAYNKFRGTIDAGINAYVGEGLSRDQAARTLYNAAVQGYDPSLRSQIDADFAPYFGGGSTGGGAGGGGGGGGGSTAERYIRDAYGATRKGLQGLKVENNKQREGSKDIVRNLFDSSKQNLDTSREGALRVIDASEQDLQRDEQRGLRSLSANARNIIQATNNQLGTFGAGDSSAASVTVPYALNQATVQAKTDFLAEITQNQTLINLQRAKTEDEYNIALNDLNTWKSNKITEIVLQYDQLASQIDQAMVNATAEEKLALAQLSTQYANSAAATLSGLESAFAEVQAQANASIGSSGPFREVGLPQLDVGTVNPQQVVGGLALQSTGGGNLQAPSRGIAGLQGSSVQLQGSRYRPEDQLFR